MKQKHWQVSVFAQTSEIVRDDTFYTTDTEAYLVFELIDEGFTPDSATITVYNTYGKVTIHVTRMEVVDGIVRYEMPVEAIRYLGDWRTQVVFTKDNEDYTTEVIEFDVGGHLLDNKKPPIVYIENWNSFIKHGERLIDDWKQLEKIRQANERQRERSESARQSKFEMNETERQNEFETNEGERESAFEERYGQLEEEYAPKLTELTSQLAQTARKDEVITKAQGVGLDNVKPDLLSAIEGGEGTSFNLLSIPRDKSVTPVKTTFINTSSNLIDESKAILNKRLDASGELIDSSGPRVTDYIPVESGSQYTVVGSSEMCFYSEKNTSSFIEINRYSSVSQPSTSQAPSNANYARYTLASSHSTPQVNEGDTLLPYEEYYPPVLSNDIRVERPPVTPKETDFIKQSSNLFNKDNVVANRRLSSDGLIEASNYSAGLDFIEVEPSTQYYIQGLRRIANYDEDKNQINLREILTADEFVTTHSQAKYVRLSGLTDNLSFMQFSKEKVPYESYGDFLSKNIKINKESLLKSNEFFNEFSKVYKSELLEGGYPENSSDIISLFDGLVDGEYVKRELLGKDDFDNDIVAYSATKPNLPNQFNFERLKIGITTGVHGNEKNPVTGFYAFMRDLIENKENNEMFNVIKSLVDFHYVPLVTPSAWNLYTRNNGNNININRNFTTNWTPREEDFGTGPASEKETQLLEQWMADNPVDYFIDVHTTVGIDNPWFGAMHEKDEGLKLIKNYYDTKMILSNWWGERPDIDFPKNTVMGQANRYSSNLPQLWVHADALGYKTSLIELASRYSPDIASGGGVTQTFSAETIGNFIIQLLKDEGVI